MKLGVAGTAPGERQLNGPQTTGRTYRNLSEPRYGIDLHPNQAVPMRDGVTLLADVYRPAEDGRFPALVALSPYPRQIQNSGAPIGFIEAGATDFFVPRGYAHVIANLRETNGSQGTWGLHDSAECRDAYDLVEWAAAQPWCDGNVGMIGISYFAMTQFSAAVEAPPHLRAIFPVAVTIDTQEAFYHGGLMSSTFAISWLRGVATFARLSDEFLRGPFVNGLSDVLRVPRVHHSFEHHNGEAALSLLGALTKGHYDPHPWDDMVQAACLDHPLRDAFWEDRDLTARLANVRVPTYLGCDWGNVPLHLPSTFSALRALPEDVPVRVALMGEFGLTWPWESLHVEVLAWFDRWLRGRDTGILEGPRIRYVVPGAGDEWRASDVWPPRDAAPAAFALRADGALANDEGDPGSRAYTYLPPAAAAVQSSGDPMAASLEWRTAPLERDVDFVGPASLRLDAAITGGDTAWIVTLRDVAPDGTAVDVTAGWRRAALAAPDRLEAVAPNERRTYEIPLIDNARRFARGHSIALLLRSDDGSAPDPIMGFRHVPVGIASRNTVFSSSRLTLSLVRP